jgi:uncharacterized protein (UPF0276 family)
VGLPAQPARPADPVGLGLRAPHFQDVLAQLPALGWFEVHSENYFGGGALIHMLERVRRDYPLALHGVAMGLLSPDPLDEAHLAQLAELAVRVQPFIVSEHLCWTRLDGVHYADLLPAPASQAFLDLAVERVEQVQDRLKRQIAVENITRYVEFKASTIPEGEFLAALARRSGCALLVDLENLHLNEINLGQPALDVLRALPPQAVAELHIAGHETSAEGPVIDGHAASVPAAVWELLRAARERFGPLPTLLERDNQLPPLAELLAECAHARQILNGQALPA